MRGPLRGSGKPGGAEGASGAVSAISSSPAVSVKTSVMTRVTQHLLLIVLNSYLF